MMKAKKVLKTTLAAVMAATTITAVAVPANAACSGWTITSSHEFCDKSSGWCEILDPRHSLLRVSEKMRYCDVNGKQIPEYTESADKIGCC